MKLIIIGIFVALMTLDTSCAQISQPVAEVAPQGTSDGIKVHGDWTVTVTNPDGTVDAVHEFENDLDEGFIFGNGAHLLTALVAGETSVSGHFIQISSDVKLDGVECAPPSEPFYHQYNQAATLIPIITRDVGPNTPVRFTASCIFTLADPEEAIKIHAVTTRLRTANSIPTYNLVSNTPSTLDAGKVVNFTTRDNQDITVKHNQGVYITVLISFE